MADSAPTTEQLLEHSEWLTRLARALVGEAAADDIVQQTYEVALATPSKREGPLRPWLGGVARNVARMATRGRLRRERREQAVAVHDDMPSPDQLLARAQLQQTVNRLVLELPEPLRSTLLLRFFEGRSAADIARAQGIPAATVRSRLKDALDRIRAALDKEHDNDRRAWIGLLAPLAIPGTDDIAIHHTAGAANPGSDGAENPGTDPATDGTTGAGPTIASTPIKLVSAICLLAIIVIGARLAGLWGQAAETVTTSTPPANASARSADGPTAVAARALPTIHDDDPKGTLRLEGQVIDEHDAPVAHASVAIDANPSIAIETESDGTFVFEGLIPRDYRIEATAGDRYAGPARLQLSAKPEPVTLRMRTGSSAAVTVTDRASGRPVAGAEVELISWLSTLTWKATTNADGIATLVGLGAGWSPLIVHAKGYARAAIMFSTSGTPGTIEHAALSLAHGVTLAGRVVDDRGMPVANARVFATTASDPEPVDFVDPDRDAVVTGADGSFMTAALSAGTWRVTATANSYAPTTSVPLVLDGEHARAGIELHLVTGAIVRGTVVDHAGVPAAGAHVSVVVRGHLPWRIRRQAVTDANGTFSIGGLEPRAVDVVAWHERGASAIVPADLATKREHDVRLTLDVTGAITGTVVDNRGQPIADAQVIATPDWSDGIADRAAWNVREPQETTTNQAGTFRFAGLPDGSYRVRAARPSAAEAVLWLATGVTTKPSTAPIKIAIPDDGRAIGTIQLADGKPATAFAIGLASARPQPFLTTDGAFTISAAPGVYTLTIAGPDFVTATKEVTITETKNTQLGVITVTAGRSISGRVLDANGVPIANATVAAGALLSGGGAELYIESESIKSKAATTDAQGRFVVAGFPSGSLTVVAGAPNLGRSASVQLPAGSDSVTLDLVVAPTSGLQGKATRNGQPLGNAIIIASPIGAMWSSFFVTTGPDGLFAFDALAPGSYVVYPMLGRGKNPGELYLRRAEVALGRTTKVEIDIEPGPITLAVSVKTDRGDPVLMCGVGAIELSIDPQTVEELRDGTQLPTDRVVAMHGGVARLGAGSLAGLRPGPHTVCAMVGDPRVASSVKLKCMQLTLTSAATQTASLVVPAAWFVGN